MNPDSSRSSISPVSPIAAAFARARENGQVALIPYVMAGYPDTATSEALAVALCQAGAAILELGVPFSDPLADGATIQRASQKALENGMSVASALELAQRITETVTTPLVLMGYYNPIYSFGLERFCNRAKRSGVAGLIVPDLPPEEAEPLYQFATADGIEVIFLVTPSSPEERIAQVAGISARTGGGFLYCVSISGVTGARESLPAQLPEFIGKVRAHTQMPLAVGFGVAHPQHVADIGKFADGAVVASALLNAIDSASENEKVASGMAFLRSLLAAS
ncbi:MAG: tryptophan synthase subunit alpha [Ktedonobacterales bacterium]